MTVYELIQELEQYDPDEEVYFCVNDEIEGTTEHVRQYSCGWGTYLYIQCRQEKI